MAVVGRSAKRPNLAAAEPIVAVVAMRDRVCLAADVYLASGAEDPRPTLLCRTPYGKRSAPYPDWARRFVNAGFGVVIQDVRGRYASEGDWEPYIHEAQDGHDTIAWVAEQPWSNGRVGMFGISYVGFTQSLAASQAPPALKAIMPIASQEDNFGHMWVDGVLQLQNAMNLYLIGRRTMAREKPDGFDERYWALPLEDALADLGGSHAYSEFLRHSTFDQFWMDQSLKGRYARFRAPALLVTGWYDNLLHEQLKTYAALTSAAADPEVRRETRLVIGPWSHFEIGERACAGVDFGDDAAVDIPGLHIEWYRARLCERQTGLDDSSASVRLFVTGSNEWRSCSGWPPAGAVEKPLYLQSRGNARSCHGDGSLIWERPGDRHVDEYIYDPASPVPTVGGQSMFSDNTGPRDRTDLEQRDDVLVYTSLPLRTPLAICGTIRVRLFASSSAPDTDFTAALVDVDPDGRATLLCEGIIRARYRESVSVSVLLHPGQVYAFEICLWERAHVFRRGHRVRCEISSSNFPRFDRNLNTGDSISSGVAWSTAAQKVWHGPDHPSAVILPVMDEWS